MQWILALIVGALAIGALTSRRRRFGRRIQKGWAEKSKKEWIVLPVGPGPNGTCVLLDETPNDLRTEFGSTLHWIVDGSCPGHHTIEIKRPFRKGSQSYEIFEDSGTKLDGVLPRSESEAPLRLKGKLKNKLHQAVYTYQIHIDGRPAESKSRADDGEVYVCPVWPCE